MVIPEGLLGLKTPEAEDGDPTEVEDVAGPLHTEPTTLKFPPMRNLLIIPV